MKRNLFLLLMLSVSIGCAKLRVEAPKEPIKVDISMRLDIYQHIEKDIDAIENIVSGGSREDKKPVEQHGLLRVLMKEAFAQEALSPEIEQAALRRKDRLSELSSLEAKGIVSENKDGLVEIKKPQGVDSTVSSAVSAENSDRMIIYQGVAKKNGTPVAEVQKLYAERLQKSAPAGTPIEVFNSATGSYEWKIK